MSIVVQKYGGSSVADVARIRQVAERVMRTRRAGHDVVVVVSADVCGVTIASVYVPNGGKDFPAKMRSSKQWTSTRGRFRPPPGRW